MNWLGAGKPGAENKGELGYYALEDWWYSTFSERERKHIEERRNNGGISIGFEIDDESGDELGQDENVALTSGTIIDTTETALVFVASLGTFLDPLQDDSTIRKIYAKADVLAQVEKDILDVHFYYMGKMDHFYKLRDKLPDALDLAIQAAENQIKIAPQAAKQFKKEYPDNPLPAQKGFKQLAIIREKQGDFDEAIRLCREAKAQGWGDDDWDNRIARYEKKRKKNAGQ